MVGLLVAERPRSLAFYRRLGLGLPQVEDAKPSMLRMASGVTIFRDTGFANTQDLTRARPTVATR